MNIRIADIESLQMKILEIRDVLCGDSVARVCEGSVREWRVTIEE